MLKLRSGRHEQIQLRDIPGFVDTRQQLLDLRPGNRNNWISFAVAHHLNSHHTLAVQVLDSYDQMQARAGSWHPTLTCGAKEAS